MTHTIRIRHQDTSTESIELAEGTINEAFGKIDQARLTADRDSLNGVSVTEVKDWVYLEDPGGTDIFGGVLKDIVRTGAQPTLVVNGWEQFARDAKPTPSGQTYQNVTDSSVVNDAISNIPNVSGGTVSNVSSGLSYLFDSVSQARKIRKVEETTPAEVKYRVDQTVDYVSSIGADKTSDNGYSKIIPSNQNVIGSPKIVKDGSGERVTHLRLRGAGEGTHRFVAEVTASSYSAGDREIWRAYQAPDLQTQDAVDERASTLIAELNDSYVEAKAAIKDMTLDLGDTVTFEKPQQNVGPIDLRVVELKTIIDEAGVRYQTTLSNRQKSRDVDDSNAKAEIDKLNTSVQGVAVPINASGGRQPLDASHNYRMKLYYPAEVEYEHRLNVRVIGLPYRSYSDASGHSHDVTVTHPSHSHNVTHPSHNHTVTHPSHDHSFSVNHPSHTHSVTHPTHDHNFSVNHPTHDHSFSVSTTSAENDDYGISGWFTDSTATTIEDQGWFTVASASLGGLSIGEVYVITTITNAASNPDEYVVKMRIRDTTAGTTFHETLYFSTVDGPQTRVMFAPQDVGTLEIQATTEQYHDYFETQSIFVVAGTHQHNISSTSTSDAALGTTESTTSDTALGTTETSTAALGTTENSTTSTDLGTNETSTSALGTTETSTSSLGTNETATSTSDTDLIPGIQEWDGTENSPAHYPENVDVLVNGTSQGTSFGDGTSTFEQAVDIQGALNEGEMNTIELSTDGLGHAIVYVEGDVYRQILGNG